MEQIVTTTENTTTVSEYETYDRGSDNETDKLQTGYWLDKVESVTCLENNAAPERTVTGGSFTTEMTELTELRQEVTEMAGGSGASWDWFAQETGTTVLSPGYHHFTGLQHQNRSEKCTQKSFYPTDVHDGNDKGEQRLRWHKR